jgi:hypothetical protein
MLSEDPLDDEPCSEPECTMPGAHPFMECSIAMAVSSEPDLSERIRN